MNSAAETVVPPGARAESFLFEAARLLAELDDAESTVEGRYAALQQAAASMGQVNFSLRGEPRRVLIVALRDMDTPVGNLAGAARNVLRRTDGTMTFRVVTCLLELLADVDISDGADVAFAAIRRLPHEGEAEVLVARAQVALTTLAALGGGCATLLSMLHQLHRQRTLAPEAGITAIRLGATTEPGRLSSIIDTVAKFVAARDSIGVGRLRQLLRDVIRRAGHQAILEALTALKPEAWPELFSAAFDVSAGAPFAIVSIKEARIDVGPLFAEGSRATDEELGMTAYHGSPMEQRRVVEWIDGSNSLDDFLRPDDQAYWHRAICYVMKSPPIERLILITPAGPFVKSSTGGFHVQESESEIGEEAANYPLLSMLSQAVH